MVWQSCQMKKIITDTKFVWRLAADTNRCWRIRFAQLLWVAGLRKQARWLLDSNH